MTDINYGELAHNTVEFLKPYLIAAGGKLAQDGLNAAREKVFGWLKSKFIKPAQSAALEVAAQAPHDPDALESLQHQIQRPLEQQEEFRKELLALLPKEILPPRHRPNGQCDRGQQRHRPKRRHREQYQHSTVKCLPVSQAK